jgi:hypothetical protein
MITTVCLGLAASAAADMLSSGDYAIAYSESIIYFHGTRGSHSELTVEKLKEVEEDLEKENEYFATKLANRMFRRFASQALVLAAFNSDPPNPNVLAVAANPVDILSRIKQNVELEHTELIDSSLKRVARIEERFKFVTERKSNGETKPDQIADDCETLKLLVDFEASVLKRQNGVAVESFTKNTIDSIQENFVSLKEFYDGRYHKQAADLCSKRGHYFLTLEEMQEFFRMDDEDEEGQRRYLHEKALPRVLPLWYLVMSLCRLLQHGEHVFSARDAWWFGLVDEVPGTELPSIRTWEELRSEFERKKQTELAAKDAETVAESSTG